MTFGLTYPQLKKLEPCKDQLKVVSKALGGAGKWSGNLVTAQMARDAGVSFDNILWAAEAVSRSDKNIRRRLRHFSADCAARVLHLFEEERPDDKRVRASILAARDYADGKIGDAARDAAWVASASAARDAAMAAARASSGAAAWAARAAERAVARDAERDAALVAARAAERASSGDAAWAAWVAARAVARAWRFDRLITWLSEGEPEPLPLPEWVEAQS